MENGSVVFRGTSSVDIRLTQPDLTEQSRDNCCRFDPSLVVWVARSTRYPQFLAHGKTDGSTLLLGPHQWTIYNDSKVGPCSLLVFILSSSDLQPPRVLPDEAEPELLQEV